MSTRRRRAAAGGCVNCQFRCQHAMTQDAATGRARRLWLVTTADRRPPGPAPGQQGNPGRPGTAPARSVPILLPMPAVRSAAPASAPSGACGPVAPQWPDRPVYRSSQVSHRAPRPVAHLPERERAGAPALTAPGVQRGWPGARPGPA
jgi:hypothetical protein